MTLRELTVPVSELRGVGRQTDEGLANLGIRTCVDLLLHLPRDYEDRATIRPLTVTDDGRPVNTTVTVIAHDFIGAGPKKTLKVYVRDDRTTAALVCFGRNFLARTLVPGKQFRLYGHFRYQYGELQSTSFDVAPVEKRGSDFDRIIPIYPATEGISQRFLRRLVGQCIERYLSEVEDEVPPRLRRERELEPLSRALRQVHFPDAVEHAAASRRTLAYRELLLLQLVVARRALERQRRHGTPKVLPQRKKRTVLNRLPFRLTDDQQSAIDEIEEDLGKPAPMARLLQGDVGSGKTLVALLTALPYIELGYQAALMAPTELLARQHAETAAELLEPAGVRVALLVGGLPEAKRTELLEALGHGEVHLVVGTHAVFTEQVRFNDLRYVIVDEQHRFGVAQRAALLDKGVSADLLLMTATPIPRTLALTVFGDMETTTIKSMPPGRKPIETHLARHGNEAKVYDWVRRELRAGRQAYFVYPLIEQSDKLALRDAESMFHRLQHQEFADFRLALIHSRIDEQEKAARMEAFAAGEIDVLVATSVVEVGVDVANATCMVVEHAERFGLAALHQLRGRVGRGRHQAYAFFVYAQDLTEEGKQRLRTLLENGDGFVIAEEDLKLRGPGELAGLRQSGFMKLRVADLATDMELMRTARRDAFDLLEQDPGLIESGHQHLRRTLADMSQEAEVTP